MIKERIFQGYMIFDIDSNGDNYKAFKSSCEYFEKKDIVNPKYRGGFDTERMNFEYLGIACELTYSGFFGTELKVDENLQYSELAKVRQWVEEIYNYIQST